MRIDSKLFKLALNNHSHRADFNKHKTLLKMLHVFSKKHVIWQSALIVLIDSMIMRGADEEIMCVQEVIN